MYYRPIFSKYASASSNPQSGVSPNAPGQKSFFETAKEEVKLILKEYWDDILVAMLGAGAGAYAGHLLAPKRRLSTYAGAGLGALAASKAYDLGKEVGSMIAGLFQSKTT